MKVLRQGKRWWAGLRDQCEDCGTTVEFAGEKDELFPIRLFNAIVVSHYAWNCPTCGAAKETTPEILLAFQTFIARVIDDPDSPAVDNP